MGAERRECPVPVSTVLGASGSKLLPRITMQPLGRHAAAFELLSLAPDRKMRWLHCFTCVYRKILRHMWQWRTCFPKMVLSLFSNPLFVQEAGQSTNVTIHSWPNAYTYRRRNLMISCGVALALTLLSCGFGCATIYLNGASYSNSLSTVLRVTRGHLEGFDRCSLTKIRPAQTPFLVVLQRLESSWTREERRKQTPVARTCAMHGT